MPFTDNETCVCVCLFRVLMEILRSPFWLSDRVIKLFVYRSAAPQMLFTNANRVCGWLFLYNNIEINLSEYIWNASPSGWCDLCLWYLTKYNSTVLEWEYLLAIYFLLIIIYRNTQFSVNLYISNRSFHSHQPICSSFVCPNRNCGICWSPT